MDDIRSSRRWRIREDDPLWRRWDEVRGLFERALDQPPEERDRFLDETCGDDVELRQTVRGLLDEADASEGRFEAPGTEVVEAALGGGGKAASTPAGLEAGTRVGRYRIVGEIGRGGMATVYEAERADGTFERTVALKVLRRGLETEEVVRRFLAERQILSELSHPNIARLIDGGATEDGRPYLVMERVEGTPFTEWAERERLTVEQRLDLFLQLADAVDFAHRRLVVHRDLKPSNVLVDDEGRAHLLDFGIAKLLDPTPGATVLTRLDGPRPLTPAFASPEQFRGDPITTASDVYQLGVLLHLLLTGRKPPGADSRSDADAALRPRPSEIVRRSPSREHPEGEGGGKGPGASEIARNRRTTARALRRSLRGDLDTIVVKALRLEPDRRYASAEALATDIRHYLAGRPIAARPPSAVYRFRKFHARNPWVVPLAAGLVLAGASYFFAVVRHSAELETERNQARAEAERADQLRSFVVDLFRTGDPFETSAGASDGDDVTVVEALEVGVERVRGELGGRPELQAAMLATIAEVHMNLDDFESAHAVLTEALELHRRSGAGDTPGYASLLGGLSRATRYTVGVDSGAVLARRRVDAELELHGGEHPRVADALLMLAAFQVSLGQPDEALQNREAAARILRNAGPNARESLASALAVLSDSYREVDRLEEAREAAHEALEIHLELLGPEHPRIAQQRVHLAQVLRAAGRLDEAVAAYREALPVLERTLGPDHSQTEISWNNLALLLVDLGRLEEAEEVHRRILARRSRSYGDVPSQWVAGSLQNLASVLVRQGRYQEADSLAGEAYEIYVETAPEGSPLPGLPLLTRTEIRLAAGDPDGAEELARAAAEVLRPALPEGHFATAMAECRLGLALVRQGEVERGHTLIKGALNAVRAWEGTPRRFVAECDAAMAELEEELDDRSGGG